MIKISKLFLHKSVINFINYYIFTIINAVISVYSISYLTKHIVPESYGMLGIYASVLYFIPALISFSTNGLQAIELVDQDRTNYIKFRNAYISFVLVVSALCLIISFLLFSYSSTYGLIIILATIMGLIQTLSTVHNTELIQNSEPTRYGILTTITAVLGLLFTLTFISLFNLDWEFRIVALILSELLMMVLRFYFLSRIGSEFTFVVDKEQFKTLLYYGSPLMISVVAGWVLSNSDRYFLLKYFSLKEVGLYAAAAGLASFVVMINSNMIKVVYPIIYKKLNLRVGKQFILKITAVYSLLILLMAGVMCSGIYFFGHWFLGEKYLEALPIAYVLCFAQAFFGVYSTTGLVIDYFKMNKMKTILVCICSVLVIISSFALIPIVGIYGPALALLLSFLLLSLLSLFITLNLFKEYNIQ